MLSILPADGGKEMLARRSLNAVRAFAARRSWSDEAQVCTLAQLKAIFPRPVACHLQVESNPALAVSTFQILEEGKKVSPQPPLPQTKQPQFLQLLLVGHILQAFHKPRCPSLDLLQPLHVFSVLRCPKLNTVLAVSPHQCRVQGQEDFPSPAHRTIPDTIQDATGLLGHLGTLLAHVQLTIHQCTKVPFHQTAFQPLLPKPVGLPGAVVTKMQHSTLGPIETHTVNLGPSMQSIQVPL